MDSSNHDVKESQNKIIFWWGGRDSFLFFLITECLTLKGPYVFPLMEHNNTDNCIYVLFRFYLYFHVSYAQTLIFLSLCCV